MIYKSNYFLKEMKLAYTDPSKSRNQLVAMPALTAIATIAIHRLLQLLSGSVLGESISHLLGASSFSLLSLYKIISVIYLLMWFFRNYSMVTFAEVSENRWYLLRKIHKTPVAIIAGTLSASMAVVITQFVEGFFLTWFIGGLFGYQTHLASMLSLFIDGFVAVFMVGLFIMFVSLLASRKRDARLFTFAWLVVNFLLAAGTGYESIVHSATVMSYVSSLFAAPFFQMECIGVVLFLVACGGIAYARSSRYVIRPELDAMMIRNPSTGKIKEERSDYIVIPKSVYVFIGKVLACIAVFLLAFVVALVALSSRTSSDEYSVLGYIPYTVHTEQLSGSVENYDFVLFKQYEGDPLTEGDIVIYDDKYTNKVTIKKVISVSGDTAVLDINVYGSGEEKGSNRSEVSLDSIRGVMVYKSSLFGALVLLSKSAIGRVLFLAIPLAIIFFYDDIAELIRRLRYTSDKV